MSSRSNNGKKIRCHLHFKISFNDLFNYPLTNHELIKKRRKREKYEDGSVIYILNFEKQKI